MNSVFWTRYDWNVTMQYVCTSCHVLDKPFELAMMHCSVEDIASVIVFTNYNGHLLFFVSPGHKLMEFGQSHMLQISDLNFHPLVQVQHGWVNFESQVPGSLWANINQLQQLTSPSRKPQVLQSSSFSSFWHWESSLRGVFPSFFPHLLRREVVSFSARNS